MLKNLFVVLATSTLSYSELLYPERGEELSYIHVLFNWEQEPNAIQYHLQISTSESFDNLIVDLFEETTLYIEKDTLGWGNTYYWKVRPVYEVDNYGQWSEESFFLIGEPRTSGQNVDIYNEELVQDGIIVYGWVTGAIDKLGNEIWNTQQILMNQINEYGQIFGQMGSEELIQGGELNFYDQILWMSPQDTEVDKHELIQLSNGNYMGFVYTYELGPIPVGDWTQNFQNLGYVADGETNEFQWRGCKIIEWDDQSGEEVWSWDPFDYFSMDDHDIHGGTWWNAANSWNYDWMHSNAIYFNEVDSMIYVSNRNLSRISKISYPEGEVVWNIGLPSDYNTGDDNICTDLLFSFQHHIQLLENGDLLFFDNGKISQLLLGDANPTSRIRRIRIIDDSFCETVWQYDLPENLYGSATGSAQLLENGNYFIYTLGNGLDESEPTVFEITSDGEIVWKATAEYLNTHWYRAYKVPSIHPSAFSVLFNQYQSLDTLENSLSGIVLDEEHPHLSFKIYNQSGYSQDYVYTVSDTGGWFSIISDTINILNFENTLVSLESIIQSDSVTSLSFDIWPLQHEYATKSMNYEVYRLYELSNQKLPNIPKKHTLYQNYPNPFNPITTIQYELSVSSLVSITVYDLMGRKIKILVNSQKNTGSNTVQWNGTNDKGVSVKTGVYFYKIESMGYSKIRKMILIK